jgi:hypothetical protein
MNVDDLFTWRCCCFFGFLASEASLGDDMIVIKNFGEVMGPAWRKLGDILITTRNLGEREDGETRSQLI